MKKTIKGWESYFGITVLDPDGFDRSDPYLYERTFTKEEFLRGLMSSTIIANPDFFWKVRNMSLGDY